MIELFHIMSSKSFSSVAWLHLWKKPWNKFPCQLSTHILNLKSTLIVLICGLLEDVWHVFEPNCLWSGLVKVINGIYGTYSRLYLHLQARRLQEGIYGTYSRLYLHLQARRLQEHIFNLETWTNTYTRLYPHLQTRRLQEHIFKLENMSKTYIQDYIYICKQEGYKSTSLVWKTWTNHTRHVLQGQWDMGQLNEIDCYLGPW